MTSEHTNQMQTEAVYPIIIENNINELVRFVHESQQKWWIDLITKQPIQRNVGELLILCVSELAEAMEGHRKNLMDDHLPHRKMFEVEIADTIIRLLDLAGGLGLDLGGAVREKLEYNANRPDHTHEARLKAGGKKY